MSVRLVTAQVNVPLLLAVSMAPVGAAVLVPMVTVLLTAEQPLPPVAVTEYVPPVLTVMLWVVAALLHNSPVPELVAVRVMLVTAQVSVPEVGAMLTEGAAVLLLTVTVVVLLQPAALPTVTE